MEEIFMAGPQVTEEDIAIVTDMLRTGWYGNSAYTFVEKFENDFAKWHGRKFALMTPNCTSAIHLMLETLGISENDEVIVPDVTWIASAAPIKYQRATPVFADVDEKSWCLDVNTIAERITKKTKAVIIVDLYGNLPNMKAIQDLCAQRGIFLLEDSAEAIGSRIGEERAGSFGDASVFSFHRTKTLTTGEGGMLLLDDEKLFNRAKFLRDHGRAPGTYFNTEVTFKYMPSNLAAALGFAQFQRIDELVEKKRWIWKSYQECLSDVEGISLNPESGDQYNSVWSTVLIANESTGLNRDLIMDGFTKLGIPTRPFFYPLTYLPAFSQANQNARKRNPISYSLSERGVCLPSALNITYDQIEHISDGFRRIIADRPPQSGAKSG
jgi:perosamine synthetase